MCFKNEKVYNSVVWRYASRVDWRATEPLDWSFFKSGPVLCRLANLKTIDGFYHVEYVPLIDRWPLILFEKLWKPSTAFIAYVSKISRQRGLDHAHSNRALERTLSTVDQALVISLCSCFYPWSIIQSRSFLVTSSYALGVANCFCIYYVFDVLNRCISVN